ncbi:hypothetical protein [Solimonas soli]|uniref:hypothetical protein n=1 Tax=Solimonas soli TaxID=413479 RepID=UPI0004872726|nr:hypothetical protein [Solimonas soli]
MSFPSGCSDHDFTYLMRLFRGQQPAPPLGEDERRLARAGWLYRNEAGVLAVTAEVTAHFRKVWQPIVVESGRRRSSS